jgi:hypothetical protein
MNAAYSRIKRHVADDVLGIAKAVDAASSAVVAAELPLDELADVGITWLKTA